MNRFWFAILALFFAANVKANLPESGWYWNPQAGGSGFNIELQDDKMFMSAFTYDTQGRSVFYTAGGVFNVNASQLSTTLFVTANGQCLGCPYVAPVTTAVAPVEVFFPTTRTVRIRVLFPSGTAVINLVRFNFGYAASPQNEHLGVWSIIKEGLGSYFGEALNMRTTCTFPNLTDAFCGERLGSSSRIALGARAAVGSSIFLILLDSSESYYTRYIYTNDTNRWTGLSTVYLKTATAPDAGSGLYFIGTRLAGPSTTNQIGLAVPETPVGVAGFDGDADATMAKLAIASAMPAGASQLQLPPEVLSMIKALPEDQVRDVTNALARELNSGK